MYNINGYSSVSVVTKIWAERRMVTSLFLFVVDSRWVRSPRGSISEGHVVLLLKVRVTRMLELTTHQYPAYRRLYCVA